MAERVVFLRPDAERIARAVRRVESLREAAPLTFRRVVTDAPRGGGVRLAEYSGAWSRGSSKTLTIAIGTASNTVSVYNALMNLPSAGARACIIGRDGTAWQLINWQQDLAYAATAAELTTTALVFKTLPVGAVGGTGTTFSVSVTTCSTATAS